MTVLQTAFFHYWLTEKPFFELGKAVRNAKQTSALQIMECLHSFEIYIVLMFRQLTQAWYGVFVIIMFLSVHDKSRFGVRISKNGKIRTRGSEHGDPNIIIETSHSCQ